jgi:adenine deaminase
VSSQSANADRSFRVSGNLIDVHRRRIYPAMVVVRDGLIAEIVEGPGASYSTFLAPGFVDAHIHIESSMLPPSEFSRLAVAHGTAATVSDPHEIGNVLGMEGIEWMLADAREAAIKICFGAPSCVPATPFDHSGADLGGAQIEEMLHWPGVGYLSEMMNYPGIIAGRPDVLAKLAVAQRAGVPIDGHAPGVRGDDLATYIAAGITTDHECVALDEAREKRDRGMKILIREGSAARNFEALWPLLRESPKSCMLCSDDRHPNDLVAGHIDDLVRRSIAHGVDPFDVWRAASVHPVEHYRLHIGLLRQGDSADMIEVDSLDKPQVLRTWIDGRLAAENGKSLVPRRVVKPVNCFETSPKRPAEFALAAGAPQARVIVAHDEQLITGEKIMPIAARDGSVIPDIDRDVLKIAVVDRYRNAMPAVALITNFGLKRGALATSVSHDSHNIVAVGTSDEDLARAVNAVVEARGGLAVAAPDGVALLPLPIAGLMSDCDGYEVAAEYTRLDRMAKTLGSTLTAPFMTLSFMALLVIPSLKLGPEGLFDVAVFRPVSMWVT